MTAVTSPFWPSRSRNERRLSSLVYPGSLATGQPALHLDDLLDARERVIDRCAALPPDLPLLLGEIDAMSYDDLQRALGRRIHEEAW